LDGSNPDLQFIKSGVPIRLAVDDAHIYWTSNLRSIGRANLDGTNPDPNFIPTPARPGDLAVDSGHIYWSTPSPWRRGVRSGGPTWTAPVSSRASSH
jgi:hypothetical protein